MSGRSKSPCGSKSVAQVASSGGNSSETVVEKDNSLSKLVIWALLILAGNMSFLGKYVQENIWGFGMFIGALFLFLPFKTELFDNRKNIPVKVEDKYIKLTLTITRQKSPWIYNDFGEADVTKYSFKVKEKHLHSMELSKKDYEANYQNPYCSGGDGYPSKYNNCKIVSDNETLFDIGCCFFRTVITVKHGNKIVLRETI